MDIESLSDDDVSRDESTNILSVSTKLRTTRYGLGYEFFKSMRNHRDNVAQYIAETEEEDTYDSLLRRCIRTALHLKKRNLSENDVVCLCSYNHVNCCVPFIACLFLGIKVASLDPSFAINDSTYLIKLVKPKVFFIVPEVLDLITQSVLDAELETEIVVYGDNVDVDKYTPFNNFLKEHQEETSFVPVKIKDVGRTAIIFFSSGTTGLPKGICNSHRALYHQGLLNSHLGLISEDTVILLYSSLYWVSAVFNLTSTILSGTARLICKSFDAKAVWNLIEKYKVTYIFFAPIQAYEMVSVGRPEGVDTSKLLYVITGGAHFSEDKINSLRDLLPGTFVFQGYGCTEISGILTYFNVTKTKDKLLLHYRPTSCGRPTPGLEYVVVDPETEEHCGPGERGELRIKSDFLLNGYHDMDSASAFDSNGWLKTGDIVYYDEDFCFYVVDRIKEMLKYRSWHVPPALLEQILQGHPSVKQSVVVGIPDEVDGDHPMAIIVLREEYENGVTPEEIEGFVAERVNDTHRLRGGVKFVKSMPMTPSGKIKKMALRNMVLKGLI